MSDAPKTAAPAVTGEMVRAHGLSEDEYGFVTHTLGRDPTFTELGIFSVMWSEHCSYKSSKVWLKTLPTAGPQVICGPGENAGIVDIGDGQCAIFKMESHNHPSYIEPYQGAATGVGGIMRDVFTMGARPLANLNALRFGAPEHPKTRHLVAGVVAGIGGYGNCVGIPTVGGEVDFDAAYNGNILVNAMCVGVARTDKVFYAAASGVGNPVVYVGSKTGRDGIHGATMASAEFDNATDEKRPTVQVGDPFTEKLLLEACLELMEEDAIIGIQDMGAAGLTSSSVEMADKGGVGIALDLDKVPQRETAMTAYEMMLSESQERMLMTLRPGREADARAIFEKWGLDFAVIGQTTDTGRLEVRHNGELMADIPLKALGDGAPEYDRPWVEPKLAPPLDIDTVPAPESLFGALEKMMGSPDLASRAWIWSQYDHTIGADTVAPPGGDAAIVRVHGTAKGLAMSVDVTPRYCLADPREGGKQAVAECWRNITATGALPLALTDCLNFGNPERPEIMGQFAAAVTGMGEAARALAFPVVSGNVSLYNETNGEAILPTPAIGGVGLLTDIAKRCDIALKSTDDTLILVGPDGHHLGCSIYLKIIEGRGDGAPPRIDLAAEKITGDFIRILIGEGTVNAVHDVSDGGLLVAVAEMALAGGLGAEIRFLDNGIAPFAQAFGEDQGRYIVSVSDGCAHKVLAAAKAVGVPARLLGIVGGTELTMAGQTPISLQSLAKAHQTWLPRYMAGTGDQGRQEGG
ncbi:Phosphoribosylformylglycinamidine synthase, synthetase subunit [hydrothermal vent metagenome]|uniref:Phosphoribosylformylglycinamidine synthase, synthetase subunit n=1 Tax=hydrothermal vent metagenome TaxID=652676 RepID=A0A3B0TPG7_9ZZZZ